MYSERFKCPFCEAIYFSPFCRCQKCNNLSHLLILLTGPGLSLKSVTSYYLHRCLKIGIVESAYLGPVIKQGTNNDELRKQRREKAMKITKVYTESNLSVIVDAAFHSKQSRIEFIKEIEVSSPHTDIIILYCKSSDSQKRKFRIQDRASNSEPLEIETMSKEEADRMLQIYEPPFNDVYPIKKTKVPIVFFNTDRFEVELHNCFNGSYITTEMEYIKHCLEKAVAIGRL